MSKKKRDLQEDIIKIFDHEMVDVGIDQKKLAQLLNKQESWVSRRFSGVTKLTCEDAEFIARKLGIKLNVFPEKIENPED